MDSRAMLGNWLRFTQHAAQHPPRSEPGTDEWHRETNALISGVTVCALLGDMMVHNPDRADWLANQIHHVLEDGEAAYELVAEWIADNAANRPVQITPSPYPTPQPDPEPAVEPDPEPAVEPAVAQAEANATAIEWLTWLAQSDKPLADQLYAQWHAGVLAAADVTAEARKVASRASSN